MKCCLYRKKICSRSNGPAEDWVLKGLKSLDLHWCSTEKISVSFRQIFQGCQKLFLMSCPIQQVPIPSPEIFHKWFLFFVRCLACPPIMMLLHGVICSI